MVVRSAGDQRASSAPKSLRCSERPIPLRVGDFFYEFRFLSAFALCNEYFASGIVDGYFDGKIPEDFFGILKFYTCEYVISEFGKSLDENVVNQISEYYDHMDAEIPKWYKNIS
jgi:hypothetical protein